MGYLLKGRRHIAFLLLMSAFTACTTAGDLAVGTACGARENLCRRDCDEALNRSGDSIGFNQCLDSCRDSAGDACRPDPAKRK